MAVAGEAGEAKMPLLDEQFEETKETLATRAEYSARAFIALNLQFDRILGTLPTDEGDEAFQYLTLEKLSKENELAGHLKISGPVYKNLAHVLIKNVVLDAGAELERETAEAELMLRQVREAMKAICDDRCADALQQLSHKMDLLSKGLDTDKLQAFSSSAGPSTAGQP